MIVGFWAALSVIVDAFPALRTALRIAGVVVALGYVTVRAVTLARSLSVPALPSDASGILRENGRLLRGVGVWFLAALLLQPLTDVVLFQLVPLPAGLRGIVATLVDTVGFVFATTGVVTVVFHAIAVGVARIEGTSATGGAADHADDLAVED
jgi:hypothetical protein